MGNVPYSSGAKALKYGKSRKQRRISYMGQEQQVHTMLQWYPMGINRWSIV